MTMRLPLVALLLLSFSSSASASPSKRTLYIAGGATLAIPTGVDMLVWGLTNKRNHAWSWHLLPIVGPIKGMKDLLDTGCTDEMHGCPGENALFWQSGLHLAAQTAGLIVITIGILKDSPPESASALTLGPVPLVLSPSTDGMMLRTGFSF